MQAGIAREHDAHHKIAVFKWHLAPNSLQQNLLLREDNYKEKHFWNWSLLEFLGTLRAIVRMAKIVVNPQTWIQKNTDEMFSVENLNQVMSN